MARGQTSREQVMQEERFHSHDVEHENKRCVGLRGFYNIRVFLNEQGKQLSRPHPALTKFEVESRLEMDVHSLFSKRRAQILEGNLPLWQT